MIPLFGLGLGIIVTLVSRAFTWEIIGIGIIIGSSYWIGKSKKRLIRVR